MTKFNLSFLITGLFFVIVGCSQSSDKKTVDSNDRTCVAGYVQTGPNNGTLEIYTKSGVVDEIQTLNEENIQQMKSAILNEISAPSDLPSQSRWSDFTCSGNLILSKPSCNSCAYSGRSMNH